MAKVFKYCAVLLALSLSSTILMAQCEREEIIADYHENYLGSQVSRSDLNWTGSTDSCQAGQISPQAFQNTLQRINYFRRLAGIPTEVVFDTTLNDKAQEAALMMKANNALDHHPPETWLCYTDVGAEAAGRSNLARGVHSANAISLYMRDPGVNNGAVGHRRWILYSRAHLFGMGSTDNTQALWVIAKKQTDPGLDFIAYPPAGFCPKPLIYPRWSFSKPGAKFDSTKISMFDEKDAPVNLEILELKNGFGDNTIVWEPDYNNQHTFDAIDHEYTVKISDVLVNGDMVNYVYKVIFTNPDIHPPICFEGSSWNENSCSCRRNITSIQRPIQQDISIFPNPFSDVITLSQLEPGSVLRFYNPSGQLYFEKIADAAHYSINTQNWATGLYILEIQWQDQIKNVKLIRQ